MQGNETVTMLLFNFKVSYANYAENTGKGESIVRTVSEYMESALNEFLFFLSYFYDVFISFIFTWYKGALNRFCFLFFFTIVMVSYVSNGSGKLARTWTDKKIKTWERLSHPLPRPSIHLFHGMRRGSFLFTQPWQLKYSQTFASSQLQGSRNTIFPAIEKKFRLFQHMAFQNIISQSDPDSPLATFHRWVSPFACPLLSFRERKMFFHSRNIRTEFSDTRDSIYHFVILLT